LGLNSEALPEDLLQLEICGPAQQELNPTMQRKNCSAPYFEKLQIRPEGDIKEGLKTTLHPPDGWIGF
jgi:hypothetical protein